tara:strand:+ start:269 stop:700 length:432 start_codon:yes stop_codon:yes gene_type:complete
MSKQVKLAILETQVERLLEKQKELTERVRANEKVVAAIGLLGSISVAFIGAGYFAPGAEADTFPRHLEPQSQQPYDGMLYGPSAGANEWIQRMKEWELEQSMKDPAFDINNALAEFFNGSHDPTEQEELLQLSSDGDRKSLRW